MKLKPNIGSTDKMIRLLIAVILIFVFYKGILSGTLGIIALSLALLLTVTSLISFCPLYGAIKINSIFTKKEVNKIEK